MQRMQRNAGGRSDAQRCGASEEVHVASRAGKRSGEFDCDAHASSDAAVAEESNPQFPAVDWASGTIGWRYDERHVISLY
jgi:hypothetical protein